MSHFTTNLPTSYLVLGLVLIALLVGMAWRNIRLAPVKRNQILLELLRLSAALMVLISIADPVRVSVVAKSGEPVILVLKDASRSMSTEDMLADARPLSRGGAASRLLEPAALKSLEKGRKVVVEEFGGKDSRGSDLATALSEGLKRHPDLAAILLVSDGDWNLGGDPASAAALAQSRGVPVFTATCGQEKYLPDLILEKVEVPAFGLVKEKVLIPFRVRNLSGREYRGRISLRSRTGGVSLSRDLVIADGASSAQSFIWQPAEEGRFDFRMELTGVDKEFRLDNNSSDFSVPVRREVIRVLIVETLPRWEYRFLRNALMRDPGVQLSTLLMHQKGMQSGGGEGYLERFPRTREELSQYDVVFLGDIGAGQGGLGEEQLASLRGLVENMGSGLVFMPGRGGRQANLESSPLGELLPVVYDPKKPSGTSWTTPAQMLLTPLGQDHLLTALSDGEGSSAELWKRLSGFYWNAGVTKAKLGAQVLAVQATDRSPLLVTRSIGNGHVLFLGSDSAWRWRRGVEDLYHYRFWGQVVRWMASRRHAAATDKSRLFVNPARPNQGELVELQASLFDQGKPINGAEVQLRLTSPNGVESVQPLRESGGGWGLYRSSFTADQAGVWKVQVRCDAKLISQELRLEVAGSEIEKIGVPARPDVLREIARVSGGEALSLASGPAALSRLASLPPPRPDEVYWRLISQFWWGLGILALFAAYWLLRKRLGLI
ncbi:MAG: hypothetical protein RL095_2269 [Verrucomicrobiota bacterium]|jgi:uncharacterized membrane protein